MDKSQVASLGMSQNEVMMNTFYRTAGDFRNTFSAGFRTTLNNTQPVEEKLKT